MVKILQRKLYRDLGRMKMQVLTIALVIASGVGAMIGFLSTQDSLKRAQIEFYQQYRFADVFGELKRAPRTLEKRIEKLPGLVNLETRIVKDFLLQIPDQAYSAVGRFISVPEASLPRLNRVYLRQGRWLDPERNDEVLMSEGFAEANGFKPGDSIAAIINGKFQRFNIVGTALSPEYIYALRGDNPIPDDRRYGIFWTSQKGLEAALDMEGSFNSFSLILGPSASTRLLIDQLDEILLPYGGLGAYERKDQVSHRFLSDEIQQNQVMAVAIPFIFLFVAAFLLNVVMSRLVGLQRSQIATLKALGYSNSTISFHYFKFVTAIVLLGVVLGIGLGVIIGRSFTQMYTDYYRFPRMDYILNPNLIVLAFIFSFSAACFSIFRTLAKIYRLQPAEAMRPPNPPSFHENFWEKLLVHRWFSTQAKMVYRNLTLKPTKTALSILGMAFGIMITMLGMFWWDTIDFVIRNEFFHSNREDATITFVDSEEEKVLQELAKYPGVLSLEPYHSIPIRLSLGPKKVETALLGYPNPLKIRSLWDQKHQAVEVPSEGVLLSHLLARRLHARRGDWLHIEVLEGKRQAWDLPVTEILYQWVGYSAYMDLKALQNRLDEKSIRLLSVQVDAEQKNQLQVRLKNTPKVSGIHFKKDTLHNFQETMVKFILVFALSLTLFAFVIAIGVVYNSVRVTLSEREWELMSLRVLGYSSKAVFLLLTSEIIWQLLISLPLGWILGYLFAKLMIVLMHTENFEIPLIINRPTFAYASLVIIISAGISLYYVNHRLKKMNIVSALKVRE